jgi:hypothetical protein
MKEQFITKNFSEDSESLLASILDVLTRYEAQGYDLSLRQLYYQLVAANVVENTERSYKNIGSLVSDARLAGRMDWDMIKDRGREMIHPPHWRNPAEIVEASAQQFRIDKWANQSSYVEVMVEKQALEGVLMPVCAELDVPFTANKGYSSSTALYEAAKRMELRLNDEREVHVIYLGDHDPSGIDMSRDVHARLNQLANVAAGSDFRIVIHRVALNMDQIRELRPPENPAKLTDSRADSYIERFGTSSWELDAIEPRRLAQLVTSAVVDLRDEPQWEKDSKVEAGMKAELLKFAKTYRRSK